MPTEDGKRLKSYRERHAELLRENKRLKGDLQRQTEITQSYVNELEIEETKARYLLEDIEDFKIAAVRREKLHKCYKDEMWVQYVEACELEYALHKLHTLTKRLEWYIRGNRPEDEVGLRRYNEIIAAINEHSSN